MMHFALKMYDYHAWANQTLLNRLKELPQEVYERQLQSVFPSISHVISHMYVVDQLWFYIVSGMDMPEALAIEKNSGEGKNANEMDRLFRDLAETYKAFLSQQEDLDKSRLLHIPWEGERETSFSEMVMHIVTHGSYHRGNVTAMLRQMGYPSVTTDATVYWYAEESGQAAI
ncbi:damage-inducible protein DinB [Alicyclobacillus curvatus]|nr:damage-inducible protein DinB [Alicyclobacillus curvatus]